MICATCNPCGITFLSKHSKLDGLVCNAGLVNLTGPKKTTKDGIETTIGASYFGHFPMTELLLDTLKAIAPSRMLIVSSCVVEGNANYVPDIDLDDLTYAKRDFENLPAYGQAKVACNLYALELADRLQGPGWARSNLASDSPSYVKVMMQASLAMIRYMTDSNEEAAPTSLHVMLNDKHRGAFFSQHSYLYTDKASKKGAIPTV